MTINESFQKYKEYSEKSKSNLNVSILETNNKNFNEIKKDKDSSKDDVSPLNTAKDQLIVEYSGLVKYIAKKISARLPASIDLDDLISSGVIGLIDAIEKYDPSRDNKFKTYAEFRIRGAILDELRSQDWVPRSIREKSKLLEKCYSRLEHKLGRQATDEEVCTELNISQNEYHDLLNEVRSVSLLSYDDFSHFTATEKKSLHGVDSDDAKNMNPFNEMNIAHLKKVLANAIQDLPEKQRLVLSLYYYEDLNLKEIGKILEVTESRVSQLHTQAVLRLKTKLKNYSNEFQNLFV
jgi:RNA polymerase sigma factor for flagellar operon FliA